MNIDELKDLAEAARKYDCSHVRPANCPYYNFQSAITPERVLSLIELFKYYASEMSLANAENERLRAAGGEA